MPPSRSPGALALLVLAGVSVALAACSFGGGIGVRGEEYRFENMPGNVAAGEVAFQFQNTGDEPHEMVVVALGGGSTSVQDVLRLPDQEAMAKFHVVARSFAEPGEEGAKIEARLGAGRYALVCFLPVAGSGPPHFTRGMIREFTAG